MLTIAKVTNAASNAGYEVEKDFCLIRNGKKYQRGALYVCKVINRFDGREGREHFVVKPLSEPVKEINYDLASKIYNGDDAGKGFLESKGYPVDYDNYEEIVQDYFASLI